MPRFRGSSLKPSQSPGLGTAHAKSAWSVHGSSHEHAAWSVHDAVHDAAHYGAGSHDAANDGPGPADADAAGTARPTAHTDAALASNDGSGPADADSDADAAGSHDAANDASGSAHAPYLSATNAAPSSAVGSSLVKQPVDA